VLQTTAVFATGRFQRCFTGCEVRHAERRGEHPWRRSIVCRRGENDAGNDLSTSWDRGSDSNSQLQRDWRVDVFGIAVPVEGGLTAPLFSEQ